MQESINPNILETRGWIERVVKDHNFSSLEDLLKYLNNRNTLDLGSGGGGFAVDHEAIKSVNPKYSGEIYSVNPRLPNPDHAEYDVYDIGFTSYRALDPNIKVHNTQQILKSARQRYEKKAIAASWERLPFPNNFFDLVFATGSYLFYGDTYSPESLEEIIRIIKPGGNLHCSLYFSNISSRDEFEEDLPSVISSNKNIDDYFFEITSSHFDERLGRDTFSGHIVFHKKSNADNPNPTS